MINTEQINDKIMNRRESEESVSTTNVSWIKWKNPGQLTTCSRKAKYRSLTIVAFPQMVKDYNKHMGHVDYADMMKSYYEIDRKIHKSWHRIFFHFLDVAVSNSYILFKHKSQGKIIPLKDFR